MSNRDFGYEINGKHILNENYNVAFENLRFKSLKTKRLFKHKVKEKQLSLIAGNLAQIYKAGISIAIALELISDTLPDKAYKQSLSKVLLSINQGKSLSEGFSEFKGLYPEFFIGIISIGENTGKLYEVLKGLSIFYDKLTTIKNEVKNASIYPIFVFASMILLCIFMINNVVPNFCEIYKAMDIKLPDNCQFLYDMSIKCKEDPLGASITVGCFGGIGVIFLKYIFEKLSIDKFTKIHMVKSYFEYIMILLFSIVSSTGINISHALECCEESISFSYLRRKIQDINFNIKKGRTLAESMESSGMFSKYTLAIISLREETGTIEEGFKELAHELELKFSEQIKKYLKWINPIFILIMAGFIVVFLLFFVLPLFDTLQSGMRIR